MMKIKKKKKYYIEDGSLNRISKNTYEIGDSDYIFSTDDLNEAKEKFEELKHWYDKVEKTPSFIQIIEFSAGTLEKAENQEFFDYDDFDYFQNR